MELWGESGELGEPPQVSGQQEFMPWGKKILGYVFGGRNDPQRERKVASGEPPEEGLMWDSSVTVASSGALSLVRDRCALEFRLPGGLSCMMLCFLPPLVRAGCGAEP